MVPNFQSRPNWTQRLWGLLLVLQTLVLFRYLIFHYLIITHPLLLNGREAAHALNTERFLANKDLYQLSSLPLFTNVYGLGYNLLVSPFALLLGSTHQVHRMVSALFLMGCSLLIYRLCRTRKVSATIAASAAMLFYMLQCKTTSLAASPDLPGLFFMLLAVAVTDVNRTRWVHLLLALVFGTFGLLIKPYFLFALPLIALTVFINESKGKGLTFLGISIATVAAILFMQSVWMPYAFYCIYKMHWITATHEWAFLREQLKYFSLYHAGILLVPFALFIFGLTKTIRSENFPTLKGWLPPQSRLLDLRSPLLSRKLDIVVLGSISAALVLLTKLGWHGGAFLIYFFHLLTPFLLVWVVSSAAKAGLQHHILMSGMAVNTIVLALLAPAFPSVDIGRQLANDRWFRGAEKNVLAAPHFADELRAHGMHLVDNGESEYVIRSALEMASMQGTEIHDKCRDYVDAITHSIKSEAYSAIILSNDYMPYVDREILRKHYQLTHSIACDMYFGPFSSPSLYGKLAEPMEVWEPKVRSANQPEIGQDQISEIP